MADGNRKEIEIKKENKVLYEEPEPLFTDAVYRFKSAGKRMIAVAIFIFIAAAVLVAAVSAMRASGDSEDTSDDGGAYDGAISDEEHDKDTEVESLKADASDVTEDGSQVSETLGEEDGSGSETSSNIEDQDKDISETESRTEAVELDLSRVDEGEAVVVNYSDKSPDIAGLIDRGFIGAGKSIGDAPLVMVIHTHTSEKYLGGEESTPFDSVAAIGDVLVSRLNSFGVPSLHCTVIHDGDGMNAYLNARETIETMLRIYPSIKYVIDLHRLELEMDGAMVKTVSGCTDGSAQIRLTVSSSSGSSWQEELSLALALRERLNRDGLRVCMPVVISPSRYNSDLSEYYIMADIGSVGNSADEAKAAAVRLADAMRKVVLE